jgi:hypothetical protein
MLMKCINDLVGTGVRRFGCNNLIALLKDVLYISVVALLHCWLNS